jgi:hypothetical protein
MLLLKCEQDMTTEMPERTLITTWENRSDIIEIMRKAVHFSLDVQNLWDCSGSMGRLNQSDTDALVGLLVEIGDLNEKLSRLR